MAGKIANLNLGHFKYNFYNIATILVDMKVCIPRNNLETSPNSN